LHIGNFYKDQESNEIKKEVLKRAQANKIFNRSCWLNFAQFGLKVGCEVMLQ